MRQSEVAAWDSRCWKAGSSSKALEDNACVSHTTNYPATLRCQSKIQLPVHRFCKWNWAVCIPFCLFVWTTIFLGPRRVPPVWICWADKIIIRGTSAGVTTDKLSSSIFTLDLTPKTNLSGTCDFRFETWNGTVRIKFDIFSLTSVCIFCSLIWCVRTLGNWICFNHVWI